MADKDQGKLLFEKMRQELAKVIVGQERLIERLLITLLSDGHLLVEGLPGLAKTSIVVYFSQLIDADCKRVQFTPDLLPADIIGTSIYRPADGSFALHKGPIFTEVLIADEINRAPPKVQSALLEVMQERQVSIAGTIYPLAFPFLVLATQNPIEQEGTYPLPEAQIDRFIMKVIVNYPTLEQEKGILQKHATIQPKQVLPSIVKKEQLQELQALANEVLVDEKIYDYILKIIAATRQASPYLLTGASPRGSIALVRTAKARAFLQGRTFVSPQDVQEVTHDVLRHRIRLSYQAEADEITADAIIDNILKDIPLP